MPTSGDDIRSRMRTDWDARAAENAYHYVASDQTTWTLEEFLASGCHSVQTFVLDDRSRIFGGRDPKDLRMLEIGCGAGRMTAALADVFGEVHAIDVSPQMLAHAEKALAGRSNVKLHPCDGASLPSLGDLAFDFVLSFIVFQHIPEKPIIETYIQEAAGRLRPGGVFKFQVEGKETSDSLDTWRGAYFGPEDAVRVAAQAGCRIVAFEGLGEQYFWLWFQKDPGPEVPDRSRELLTAELARRRTIAQRVGDELAARTAWAKSLDERVGDLGRTVSRLQQELDAANRWALSLEAENRHLREVAAERTAWAQDRDEHAANLASELESLQREFEERSRWARGMEAHVEERTQWARRLEAELELHRGWLAAIERSWFYRAAARLSLVPSRV